MDPIDRQAALDAFKICGLGTMSRGNGKSESISVVSKIVNDYADIVRKRIDALPSAQPEIIYCKDCMHNGSFDTDCPIDWNGKEYCSFAERRTE